MHDAAAIAEFVGIGELAETTTQLLALNMHQSASRRQAGPPGQIEFLVLQRARDYLHKVREGFVLSVRTAQTNQGSEIRFLLDRVLADWDQFSRELGLDVAANESVNDDPAGQQRVERVRDELLAFGMAAIALGALPRLPAKQVTFPHSYSNPPTYSDIPVPNSPGEMLVRIEELEQTVWRLMSTDMQELVQRRYGPLRRTYGFFEASAWLSRKEAERFGVKRRAQLTHL